jgi:hypothetical protein
MIAEDAVRQGFDEIQHVNFLFLNFMPDVAGQTQTPLFKRSCRTNCDLLDETQYNAH